jgi:hypothetical protein
MADVTTASDPQTVYRSAQTIVEEALADIARVLWAGDRPDGGRPRRALIALRHEVPNDKSEPATQVVRDLITLYADLIVAAASRDSYHRGVPVTGEQAAELERVRPRAARLNLPVLDPLTGEFSLGRGGEARRERRPSAPARADAPAAGPPPAEGGPVKRPHRRRRSRRPKGDEG